MCARREVSEETGLELGEIQTLSFTNDIFQEKHYVTLWVIGESKGGEAQVLEPKKCEQWEWFSWNALPSPLFLPIENFISLSVAPFLLDQRKE